MVPRGVLAVDVVNHEDDGKGFDHLEVVDAEAFPDDFEEDGDEDVEIEERQFFEAAVFVESLVQFLLVDHSGEYYIAIGGSVGVPEGVLHGLDHLRQRVYDLVLRVEPGLHLRPEPSQTLLEIAERLVVEF